MRATTANFAVGLDRADIVERRATGAGDKLTNARGIGLAVGVLGRKPFVDVIVTCDPDTRPVPVQNPEEVGHVRLVTVVSPRTKTRVVPVS